jgi:hypothetical protein
VALVEERRLIIDASLGHKHKDRANANCFYNVQLWADGKVTAAFGRLEQEGKGGSYQIVAMDCMPARLNFQGNLRWQNCR